MNTFASPNLKLDRAYEHYTAFNEQFTAFQQANPYTAYKEFDPYSGAEIHKLKLVGRPSPDPRLGTNIGDFASNLRGALDHLVWAMSVKPEKPRKVEFPIEDTPDKFDARRKLAIGAIPEESQDIINDLQPYKRWGVLDEDPLWRIKCIANADKHRTVSILVLGFNIPFGLGWLDRSTFFFPISEGTNEDPVIPTPSTSDQAMGRNARMLPHTQGHLQIQPTFAVVTNEGLAIPVGQLLGLHEFVSTKVFPRFPERLFPK